MLCRKKSKDIRCIIRTEIETLTERHALKEITLLEFIHGLSVIIAGHSATVLRFSHSNTSFLNLRFFISLHAHVIHFSS